GGVGVGLGGVAFGALGLGAGGRTGTPRERHVRRSARGVARGAALAALGNLAHLGLTVLAVRGVSSAWVSALFEASFFRADLGLVAAAVLCAAAAAALAAGGAASGRRPAAPLAAAPRAFRLAVGGAFTSHAEGRLAGRAPLLLLDAVPRAAAFAWPG